MKRKFPKIFYFLVCFLLIFEQSGFAQAAAELNLAGHFIRLHQAIATDRFRPLHLRYLSYDSLNNNFNLFLDKGDLNGVNEASLRGSAKELLRYFFVGVSLPNDSFWVNLRPDSPDNIIDTYLAQTDVGKILLEADLQLKKDTANFTSPQTPEGKAYWNKLYQKAGELFGSDNITIPTLTRPWIVPNEIIIREAADNAYIYKATLKVMLEQDYLKGSSVYNFTDVRLKQLNEYSSQLIRETIIPKLTKDVNTAKRYAPLRQVYYSLILAQWFKQKFYGRQGLYSALIDRRNLTGLGSKEPWSKAAYFQAYQKSFQEGEYNIKEQVYSLGAQTIRSYMSGGIALGEITKAIASSAVTAGKPFTLRQDYLLGVKTLDASQDEPFKVIISNASVAAGSVSSPVAAAVKKQVQEVIEKRGGKITFEEFMRMSLYHPEAGYYSGGTVKINVDTEKAADFGTFPEIAPRTFGYAAAEQLVQMWENMGSPAPFKVIEMGAGNGTWAANILEYLQKNRAEVFKVMDYTIVEISPELTKRQKTRLADKGYPVRWILSSAADLALNDIEGVFISNELPDAFPVHKVKGKLNAGGKKEIKEVYVKYQDGKFQEELGEISNPKINDYLDWLIRTRGRDYVNAALAQKGVAVNLDMLKWQDAINKSLKKGYVITIDTGFDKGALDALDAAEPPVRVYSLGGDRQDQERNPEKYIYGYPGTVDMISDVDFKLLAEIGNTAGLAEEGIAKQYEFFTNILRQREKVRLANDLWDQKIHNDDGAFYVLIQSKGVKRISLIGLNPSPASASSPIVYFDADQNRAMALLRKDSSAWVVFADMLKLSLRNDYYGMNIADIFIADAIRIAKDVLSRQEGMGFRLGERSDEVAMVLPGSLDKEEVKRVLQNIQEEIKKEYLGYAIARLPDGLADKIKGFGRIRAVQRTTRESREGGAEYITTAFLVKDSGDIGGRLTLDRILKESGQVPGLGEVEEALPPYLPAGAVRLQGEGALESKLESSLQEAEIFQRVAKQAGQIAGVEGLNERPQTKEGSRLSGSEFSKLQTYINEFEKSSRPLREFVKMRYGDNTAKQVQLDNGYAAFMRQNLYVILEYAIEKMKSLDSFMLAVRGPPDNFYIITSTRGKWQITAVRQNILTAEGSSLEKNFLSIIEGAGRKLRSAGKFPFKVINDFDELGHYFGNQLIKLDNVNLLDAFNNQIYKAKENNGILDTRSISEALSAASGNINNLLSKNGFDFSVNFEAVSVTSNDFSEDKIQPDTNIARAALDIIEKLNASRKTVDTPVNSVKFYSEYQGHWQEVANEIGLIAAKRATNAQAGLKEAHKNIGMPGETSASPPAVTELIPEGTASSAIDSFMDKVNKGLLENPQYPMRIVEVANSEYGLRDPNEEGLGLHGTALVKLRSIFENGLGVGQEAKAVFLGINQKEEPFTQNEAYLSFGNVDTPGQVILIFDAAKVVALSKWDAGKRIAVDIRQMKNEPVIGIVANIEDKEEIKNIVGNRRIPIYFFEPKFPGLKNLSGAKLRDIIQKVDRIEQENYDLSLRLGSLREQKRIMEERRSRMRELLGQISPAQFNGLARDLLEREFSADNRSIAQFAIDPFSPAAIDGSLTNKLIEAINSGQVIRLGLNHLSSGADEYSQVMSVFNLLEEKLSEGLSSKFKVTPYDLKNAVRELLMNAFLHGNKLDFSLPIYLYFDFSNQKIEIYDLAMPPSPALERDKAEAEKAGIGGQGSGLGLLSQLGWSYKLDPVTASGSDRQIGNKAVVYRSSQGGIDFRALPIVSQPVLINPRVNAGIVPPIPLAELNSEWLQIENMLAAGITPSSERIKEYLQSCYLKQDFTQDIDKVLSCIASILRLEEESAVNTDSSLREMLVLLESDKPAGEMQVVLAQITVEKQERKLIKQ